MILRDILLWAQKELTSAGLTDVEFDIRLLAMDAFDLDYTGFLLGKFEEISVEQQMRFEDYIAQRKTFKPCQYITGTQDFMGFSFYVKEGVLIPRPETELLVEQSLALTKMKQRVRALDVCSGSGCIGISYALLRRTKDLDTEMTLLDISDIAVSVAEENKKRLQAEVQIIQSDLFLKASGKYDIIISNPPYIRSADVEELMRDVKDFEPRLALDGKEDGLYFYNRIIREAKDYLVEGGCLIFEIGYDQYEDIRQLFIENGYQDISLIKDYSGLDRIVSAYYYAS